MAATLFHLIASILSRCQPIALKGIVGSFRTSRSRTGSPACERIDRELRGISEIAFDQTVPAENRTSRRTASADGTCGIAAAC